MQCDNWFHVRRCFERLARELFYLPHREKFGHYLSQHSHNLERVQHSLWNSGIVADWYMKIFRCGLVEDAWDHPEIDIGKFQAIETRLDEIRGYLHSDPCISRQIVPLRR